jgi:hypothetical protein
MSADSARPSGKLAAHVLQFTPDLYALLQGRVGRTGRSYDCDRVHLTDQRPSCSM